MVSPHPVLDIPAFDGFVLPQLDPARLHEDGGWLDLVPAAVVVVDTELRCHAVNRKAVEWYGLQHHSEVVGRPLVELLTTEVMQANLPYLRAALSGAPQQFQRTGLTGAGVIRHAQVDYVPYGGPRGEVAGLLLQMVDIGERISAEMTLRQQASQAAGNRERALIAAHVQNEVVRPLFTTALDLTALLYHDDESVRRRVGDALEVVDTAVAGLRAALSVGSVRTERVSDGADEHDLDLQLPRTPALTAELVAANVGDLVMIVNDQNRIRWASPSALWVTGWLPEQLHGLLQDELVHPDDRAETAKRLAQISAADPTQTVEYRQLRPDGSYAWVEDTARLLGVDHANGLIITSRDVSEQRSLRQALAEALETFEQSFLAAPIGKALVAPDGRWLRVNPAMAAITGRTEAELLALTFQDITHPDDLDNDLQLLADVIEGRRDGYQMSKRYLRRDGGVVWVQLNVACVRHDDGTVRFLIAQVLRLPEPPPA